MASLSLCPQFETNLMSNRNVIGLLLQLKSANAHGKNYIKVKAHLVRHLLRNRILLLKHEVRYSWECLCIFIFFLIFTGFLILVLCRT